MLWDHESCTKFNSNVYFFAQDQFVASSSQDGKETSTTHHKVQGKFVGGGKLTQQLIDQGLLTKGMIEELKGEWEEKDIKRGIKSKRDGGAEVVSGTNRPKK